MSLAVVFSTKNLIAYLHLVTFFAPQDMETIDFETSPTTTMPQVTNSDMSVEESMLFSNFEASDFPPCKIRYFNPSVDFVAILASHEAKKFNSLTYQRQIRGYKR
jgi:hypothetical protein